MQAIDSKKAQATVPADDAMIKTQIVKELGGHKVFDRKVQDALQATWAGYIAHAELSAVVAKLPGPSEKEKKDWGNKGRNEFLKLLKKHNQRQLPQEPMPCKAKSIDLQGMEVTEKGEGMLAQVVSRVPGFTRVNLSGCKLGDGFVKCLVALLDEGGLAGVESLSLESNAISEQGIQDLAAAIARGGLPSCTTICLDDNRIGHALQIDELKGTKPTEKIDLSRKGLGVASAFIIASCIKENGVLKELKCAARPKSVRFCVSAR